MITAERVVSQIDRLRLASLVPSAGHPPGDVHLANLAELLETARAVPPQNVPPDMVTMNSTVRLRDPDTGDVDVYTLTYPHDIDRSDTALSILTRIGAAMFGARVGEEIRWQSPRRLCRAVIEGIDYQPEREGHFDR